MPNPNNSNNVFDLTTLLDSGNMSFDDIINEEEEVLNLDQKIEAEEEEEVTSTNDIKSDITESEEAPQYSSSEDDIEILNHETEAQEDEDDFAQIAQESTEDAKEIPAKQEKWLDKIKDQIDEFQQDPSDVTDLDKDFGIDNIIPAVENKIEDKLDMAATDDLISKDVADRASKLLGELKLKKQEKEKEQPKESIEDFVKEMVRPMLKSWLDANLEEIVRDVVEVEIKKITQD
jgi:cell pole-organizing protein PopZ